jgi:hypothetical protein
MVQDLPMSLLAVVRIGPGKRPFIQQSFSVEGEISTQKPKGNRVILRLRGLRGCAARFAQDDKRDDGVVVGSVPRIEILG